MHRVPYSFLVCPIPQQSLQFLQEETMKNSKNFGARNLKDKSSPVVKYTIQVSDSAMYYCLLRDTVPRAQGQLYKNLKGPCEGCSEAGSLKLRSPVLPHSLLGRR